MFPTTKPKSMTKLVTMMKRQCLRPSLVSAVASLAATLPAGYSAPIPIPRKNRQTLKNIIMARRFGAGHVPTAQRREKNITIIVADTIPTCLPHLSEIYPKRSCPTTNPVKVILGTRGVVGNVLYWSGYILPKMVLMGPAILFRYPVRLLDFNS